MRYFTGSRSGAASTAVMVCPLTNPISMTRFRNAPWPRIFTITADWPVVRSESLISCLTIYAAKVAKNPEPRKLSELIPHKNRPGPVWVPGAQAAARRGGGEACRVILICGREFVPL